MRKKDEWYERNTKVSIYIFFFSKANIFGVKKMKQKLLSSKKFLIIFGPIKILGSKSNIRDMIKIKSKDNLKNCLNDNFKNKI